MMDSGKQEDLAGFLATKRKGAYERRAASSDEAREQEVSLWLITFGDIMALMLTFFVLMYSMSSLKEDKWKELSSGLNGKLSKKESSELLEAGPQEGTITRLDFTEALNLDYLRTIISGIVARDNRLSAITITQQTQALLISIPEDILFEKEGGKISKQGEEVLFAIGSPLARVRNRIEVAGFVAPPKNSGAAAGEVKSMSENWDTSLIRAASVAAVLEKIGYAKPVSIRGMSIGRYQGLPKNMPEAERLSLSDSVDLVIMRDGDNQKNTIQLENGL